MSLSLTELKGREPILVFMERRGGLAAKASLEALGQAALLGVRLGREVWAAAFGSGEEALAAVAGRYGAGRLIMCDRPEIETQGAKAFACAAGELAEIVRPSAIFMAGTAWGHERCARLAAHLGVGMISSVVGWRLGASDRFEATRAVYGGRLIEGAALQGGRPWVAALRQNLFPLNERPDAPPAEIAPFVPSSLPQGASRLAEIILEKKREAALAEAEIVVSGGGGVGGPEGFAPIRDLADALGGVVGASRVAVDAGWMPPDRQVGQTGTIVSPKLYVACGISGAVQHRAGIRNARYIVAINSNPEAPIFKFADVGVVGDLFEIVPALAEAVRRRRSETVSEKPRAAVRGI